MTISPRPSLSIPEPCAPLTRIALSTSYCPRGRQTKDRERYGDFVETLAAQLAYKSESSPKKQVARSKQQHQPATGQLRSLAVPRKPSSHVPDSGPCSKRIIVAADGASNPVDEMAEVWSDVEALAMESLVATLVILISVVVLVRFSLRPL